MSFTISISDRFRNRTVDFFNEFSFTLQHDAVGSTFSFSSYFDPYNPEHKEMYCVSHFHDVTVKSNDEVLIFGNILTQSFVVNEVSNLVSINGYSRTGILEDSTVPLSCYPLQSNGMSLYQIAKRICDKFNIKIIVDPSVSKLVNSSYKSVTASESESIKSYLSNLASQKNVIITHTNKGELYFTTSKTNATPILDFDLTTDRPNGMTFSMDYSGQPIHSVINVLKQASVDDNNSTQYSIRNPYVLGSYFKPTTEIQSSGEDIDARLVARRSLSNELKNIKLTISIDRWDLNGKVIRPNNIISILAPHLFIYKKSNWFIESVEYTGNNEKQTAVLNCVLPEVYNNSPVKSIFEGINMHA